MRVGSALRAASRSLAAALSRRDLAARTPGLRQADRDRLLATLHSLSGATALELTALHLVERLADLRLRRRAVSRHGGSLLLRGRSRILLVVVSSSDSAWAIRDGPDPGIRAVFHCSVCERGSALRQSTRRTPTQVVAQ